MKKLYIKVKRDKKETVNTYLNKFFNAKIADEGRYLASPLTTYRKPNFYNHHCEQGRARSIDDVYSVCLSRFPNLTFKTFSERLLEEMKRLKLHFLKCPDIGKWVVRNSTYSFQTVDESTRIKDLPFYRRRGTMGEKGRGNYSVEELLLNAGINKDYLE